MLMTGISMRCYETMMNVDDMMLMARYDATEQGAKL